ncbi:pseudaminic acid cytidylyltransferase [Lentilitoribacter sp. EG35]|uniref:pseudaminic acid cytidylyltransferase n=1 Tax=Lentilitoribacter sp. EG35 TaxID=3234192 RepID=UPI00345FC2AD
MKLAVIPARGGSKRIPRKNIRLFNGKPMIAWSIEAARASKCFDRIIVSTDDQEIAEFSRSTGADVPFIRPDDLSDDHTATVPVVNHAIGWQIENGIRPQHVCCIYATAPLIASSDILEGSKLVMERFDFAFSVTTYAHPIQRAFKIGQQNGIEMFSQENYETRSQDLEEAYHDAGQFYWGKADAWLQEQLIFGPNSAPIILPRYRAQDIDTEEDWHQAELMAKAFKRKISGL